jgi:hypothetical protein
MKALFCLVVLIGLLTGCRSQRATVQVPVETRTTVVEKLVEVQIPADSAWFRAYLECDSNFNVVLKRLDEQKTAGMTTGVKVDSGQVSYRVVRVRDKVYLPARDSIIIRDVPVIHEVPVTVNELTGWQYFQIWCGRIWLACLLLTVIYLLIKWKLQP